MYCSSIMNDSPSPQSSNVSGFHISVGLMVDVKASAGFNFDGQVQYEMYRTFVAKGKIWTHVLNNRLEKVEVRPCSQPVTTQQDFRWPAVTGRGTSFGYRRDTRPRPCTGGLPAPQFLRKLAAPEGRRFQLSLNMNGPPVVLCALCMAAHRGNKGKRGSRRLRNTGRCALTASRKDGPPASASDKPKPLNRKA